MDIFFVYPIQMHDADNIDVLKRTMEQLYTEVNAFLGNFKTQVSWENEQNEQDMDIITRQHINAYNSVMAEWDTIKKVHASVYSIIRLVSPTEVIESFEALLAKLSTGEDQFKHFEFQIPYQLSSLVSNVKAVVRNYLVDVARNEIDNADWLGISPTSATKSASLNLNARPISTQNVRAAAKKFQQLTENIAESAKPIKRDPTKKASQPKVDDQNSSSIKRGITTRGAPSKVCSY